MTARTVSKAVTRSGDGPIGVMWSRRGHFNAVLPQSVDVEAFLGTAAGALYANPELMAAAEASPEVPDGRADALRRPRPPARHRRILPDPRQTERPSRESSGSRVTGGSSSACTGPVRSPKLSSGRSARTTSSTTSKAMTRSLSTSSVVEGTTGADFFGAEGSRNRGVMVGVYAYAKLTTGAQCPGSAILTVTTCSPPGRTLAATGPNTSSPWNRQDGGKDHPEFTGRSMWWKTAARRLEPWVPTSAGVPA